ncbi:MAG TPA: metallophosphoesterase family protein, partial [Segetibacter sp.]
MGLKLIIKILFISLMALQVKAQDTAATKAAASKEMLFTSDTQGPIWVESILLRPDHNRSATKSIFGDMLTRQPKAVYILGDVVNLGNSNKQWKPMDVYLKNLRSKGISVNAALGNHEVMGQAVKGQKKFQKRFPTHVNTGYLELVDSVAI